MRPPWSPAATARSAIRRHADACDSRWPGDPVERLKIHVRRTPRARNSHRNQLLRASGSSPFSGKDSLCGTCLPITRANQTDCYKANWLNAARPLCVRLGPTQPTLRMRFGGRGQCWQLPLRQVLDDAARRSDPSLHHQVGRVTRRPSLQCPGLRQEPVCALMPATTWALPAWFSATMLCVGRVAPRFGGDYEVYGCSINFIISA